MGRQIAILFGIAGHGKTSLFNKICNTQETVQAGGQPVTLQSVSKNSAYGIGFELFDTPGFCSFDQNLQKAVLGVLTENTIDRILIVMKIDRLDKIFKQLNKLITQCLPRYRLLMTVVITHWDLQHPEEKENKKMQITNKLEEEFNIHSVIFVSESTSGVELCSKIEQILKNSSPQQIWITESELLTNWDLQQLPDYEYEISYLFSTCKKDFSKKRGIIQDFISSANLDILYDLTQFIKQFVNLYIEEFCKENFERFSSLEQEIGDAAFLIYYQLKREMIQDLNHLTKTIQEKMFSFPQHCFNFIKRCPFCNEIWMKVTNCNEKIAVCGYLPRQDEQENYQQQTEKYNFYFQGNELKYQIVPVQEQTIKNWSYPQQSKKIGCRRSFYWNEAAPLTPGQIRELSNTEVSDFLAMDSAQISEKQQNRQLQSILYEIQRIYEKHKYNYY